MNCVKSGLILMLFECLQWPNLGLCLTPYQLLFHAPHLAKDFSQIVIFTDDHNHNHSQFKSTKHIGNNLVLAEIDWNISLHRSAFLNNIIDIDADHNTAIFISGNETTQMSIITEIAKKFKDNLEANANVDARDIPIHYPWNAFYFLLWPKQIVNESKEDLDKIANFLQNLTQHFPLNSNIYCVAQLEQNKDQKNKFLIWEVFHVKDNKFILTVDQKILKKDFLWKLIKFKYPRRKNFSQAVITATAVIDEVYFEETRWNENFTQLESGVAVTLYRIFRDELNFSENAIVGQYMLAAEDNSSAEMQVYLINGTADISITESAVGADKAQMITYLHSVAQNWLQARFVQTAKSKWQFFLSPFSHSVWFLIVINLFLTVASVTYLRYRSVRSHETEDEFYKVRYHPMSRKTRLLKIFSLIHLNFLWILGTLCQQGWYEWPTRTPMKILCFVASTSGFLLFAAYAGTITSQLSVNEPNTVNFENLLNSSYSFFLEVDFNFPVENNHSDPSKNHPVTTVDKLEDVVLAIKNISVTKTALISYPEFFSAGIRQSDISPAEACECFTTIRVSKTPNLCSMAVSKSSPFKEIFNIKTLLIWQRGILFRLTADYIKKTQLRCYNDNHTHKPQKIKDLFVAFALIGAGIMFSLSTLFIENCVKFYVNFVHNHSLSRQVRRLEKQTMSTITLSTTSSN